MKHAVVCDNEIREFDVDPDAFHPDLIEEVPDEAATGWRRDGEGWAPPPQPTLDDHRAAAMARALAMIDQIGAAITAGYTDVEQKTWPGKGPAAAAYVAGSATADQTAMIETEATVRGVPPADLAALIVSKETEFLTASATLAGLRGRVEAEIEAAADDAALSTVLAELETDLAAAFGA